MGTIRSVYSRNHWQDQPLIPIILCEKDGFFFLKNVTDPLHVRLFLSKGTHGRSHLVKLAQHVASILNEGKLVKIGYVGDFDADGLDMEYRAEHGNNLVGTRSTDGLRQILAKKHGLDDTDGLSWVRLGLTEEQLLNLPINARVNAKRTSNNFAAYKEKYEHLFTEQLVTRSELAELHMAADDDPEDYDDYVYRG